MINYAQLPTPVVTANDVLKRAQLAAQQLPEMRFIVLHSQGDCGWAYALHSSETEALNFHQERYVNKQHPVTYCDYNNNPANPRWRAWQ